LLNRLRFQSGPQIGGAQNGPNVGDNSFAAQNFRGIDGRDAKADMTDIPVGGKILIS
jgi:hypothetical protein